MVLYGLNVRQFAKKLVFSSFFGMTLLYCKHDAADLLFDKKIVAPTIPEVINVTSSNANGTYSTGSLILIQVVFNTTVIVTGTPRLILNTGNPATTNANYTSGSGTDTLTFTYTVVALNANTDLDYNSAAALILNGGTIAGTTGITAILTLAAPGAARSLGANKDLNINTTVPAPTVSGVTSSTGNGNLGAGQTVSIQVNFSANVNVTGTPQLILSTGTPTTTAVNYSSGTGTNSLTFTYTAAVGNNSPDLDYASTAALVLNGGTIFSSTSPNPAAILTLAAPGAANSLGANKAIVIDAVAPVITDVTASNANNTYGPGTNITIQMTFSKIVSLGGGGPPRLTLSTGSPATTTIDCGGGSGTTTLTCSYTVASGNVSADLAYPANSSFVLNGTTIRDSLNNDAVLTLPDPGTSGSLNFNKNIVIDGVAPTVMYVTSSNADDVYTAGETISIKVVFSEIVQVSGTPKITLVTGTPPTRQINYTTGNNSDTLTFDYVVNNNEASPDLDYELTTSLIAGTSIQDNYGNNAVLTLAVPGATNSLGANKNIKIDTTAPTVTNVTSANSDAAPYQNNGTANIDVQVVFSKRVYIVGGPPTLTLQGQSLVVVCLGVPLVNWPTTYTTGSGSTTLNFHLTPPVGNCTLDLDYIATNPLQNGGGTVRDFAGNNADLTLPAPGTAGSLGANKNIKIN